MSNVECSCLILRASDLAVNAQNANGICNQYRTSLTWTNIDLRTVLGDMYYKYDLFNLALTTVATEKLANAIAAGGYASNDFDNIYTTINISGLPFKNQTYSQPSNHNTQSVCISTFQFPSVADTSTFQNYNNPKFITFGKSQDVCNINIQFNRLADNLVAFSAGVANNLYPRTTFIFSIYGIEKEFDNENGMRIIM
jgi:hypothetical protein